MSQKEIQSKEIQEARFAVLKERLEKSQVIRFCIKKDYHFSLKQALKIANDYLLPDYFDSVWAKFRLHIDRKTLAKLVPKVDIKFEKCDKSNISPNKLPLLPDEIPLFLYCSRTSKTPDNLTIYLNEAFRDRLDRIRPEKEAQQMTIQSQKRLNYLQEYKTIVLYLALLILRELGDLMRNWRGFDQTPSWLGKEPGTTVEKQIFGRQLYFGFIVDENDSNNFDTYGLTTQIIASLYDISEDPSKPRTFKERICFWAPIKQSYIDKAFAYSIESGSGSRNEFFVPSCLYTDIETNTTLPENVRHSMFKSGSDSSSQVHQQPTPMSTIETIDRLDHNLQINSCWCPTMMEDYKFIDFGPGQIQVEDCDVDEIFEIEKNELEAILNSK